MGDVEEIVRGLSEAQRAYVRALGVNIMLASEIAFRCGEATGSRVGHFARRSPLFKVFSRTKNHTALCELSDFGLRVQDHLLSNPSKEGE